MPLSIFEGFDHRDREALKKLLKIVEATNKWYWRALGALVAASAVASAIFEGLQYFLK